MRIRLPLYFLAAVLLGSCNLLSTSDPDAVYFAKADSLLNLLTLEEKAGQMTNIGLTALTQGEFWTQADTLLLDSAKMSNLLITHGVGSVQNKGKYPPSKEEWYRIVKSIQDFTQANSRHQIPVLFGIDGVHGATYTASSTIFPHQIALAATWNPEFSRITGEVTAYELRASSIPWNYAPVLDVSMQPLWGRIFETFGEDTYINRVMGAAYVEGAQGKSISDSISVAVCLKHFIGYGTPVSGKDRSPALIPEHYLRQYYLEPFRDAIDKGALTVMLNSGAVNGVPGHIDKYLITDVLKGELGLKGFVITDWGDIARLVENHFVAKDMREATKMAVLAGADMCMVPYDASFAMDVVDLVQSGEIPMSRIDDAVRRILFVKFKLGLFEKSYHHPASFPKFASDSFANLSRMAALEAITLLKNEGNILPLRSNVGAKVFVTGPTANSLTSLNGPWSRTFKGDDPTYDDKGKKTFLQAMQAKYGNGNVLYAQGTDFTGDIIDKTSILSKASNSEVVFICLGEQPTTEKFSDIHSLDLPPNQQELVKLLHTTGKPIVLVLLQGRPRVIREIEPLADAILMAYWPGHEGGEALAQLISGEESPSGKLPYTYPRYTNTLHTYQHKGSDRLDDNFGMNGFNPQWQFGYGLSYTSFGYSNFTLSTDTINTNYSIKGEVTVTNTGKYAGKEVVQLYIRDVVASITPDDRKLVGFEKISLNPGQSAKVSFTVSFNDLKFVGLNNKWIAEEGDFKLLIGGNPSDMVKKSFYYKTSK
ncbi:MAG: glycoside hydrolase family 3 N-terminal domain-containing protein [Tenuifilaceae bacterium]|nr:glycoside hydrolase family 3 N-terminal domain-containing protein [Tenuifilaceae bacterium]